MTATAPLWHFRLNKRLKYIIQFENQVQLTRKKVILGQRQLMRPIDQDLLVLSHSMGACNSEQAVRHESSYRSDSRFASSCKKKSEPSHSSLNRNLDSSRSSAVERPQSIRLAYGSNLMHNQSQFVIRRQKTSQDLLESSPFNLVASIYTLNRQRQKDSRGSASMIAANLALTAGHNFLTQSGTNQPLLMSVQKPSQIFIGVDGEYEKEFWHPQKTFWIEKFAIHPRYEQCLNEMYALRCERQQKRYHITDQELQSYSYKEKQIEEQMNRYDYALVKLYQNVERASYFKLKELKDKQLYDRQVTVTGYEVQSGPKYMAFTQYSNTGRVIKVDRGVIGYRANTEQQQSGGPGWCRLENDQIELLSVHTRHFQHAQGPSYKIGVRVTQEMIKFVRSTAQGWRIDWNNNSGSVIRSGNQALGKEDVDQARIEVAQFYSKEFHQKQQINQEMRLKLCRVTQELQDKQRRIKDLEEKLRVVSARNQELRQNTDMMNLPGQAQEIRWQNHPQIDEFFIIQARKITSKCDQPRQLVSRRPLLANDRSKVVISVSCYKQSSIMAFGIITEKMVKKQKSRDNKNCISLNSHSKSKMGVIKSNSDSFHFKGINPCHLFVPEGKKIRMVVDLTDYHISFQVEGNKEYSLPIQGSFREEEIQAFIEMNKAGDSVELHESF